MGMTPRQRLFRSAFSQLRVFPVLGWGGRELWQRLLGVAGINPCQSPDDCDLFVLAGEIPSQWSRRLSTLLESAAQPCSVLWLRPAWQCESPAGLPIKHTVSPSRIEALRAATLADELLEHDDEERPRPQFERAPTEAPVTGGTSLVLGPHFPYLPSGLQLELRLDGERVLSCEGVHNAFPLTPLVGADPVKIGPGNLPALKILLGQKSSISALESARWYSHLSWMADFLMLAGFAGAASQLRPLRRLPDRMAFRRILTRVEPRLKAMCRGVGRISPGTVQRLDLRGPVARASGVAVDSRQEDSAYRSLGFEPVLESDGDAWARWSVRARECLQSLDLIARARQCPASVPEAPRGAFRHQSSVFVAPTTALYPLLETRLGGNEWSAALLFIASLDLCPQEAALQ